MMYVISEETRELDDGQTVHRIVNLDGEKGGFIQSVANLSQGGTCWVHGDSVACDEARVEEDAQIYGVICDGAVARGRAVIHGRVHGSAIIEGDAKVYGAVGGTNRIAGNTVIYGSLE